MVVSSKFRNLFSFQLGDWLYLAFKALVSLPPNCLIIYLLALKVSELCFVSCGSEWALPKQLFYHAKVLKWRVAKGQVNPCW